MDTLKKIYQYCADNFTLILSVGLLLTWVFAIWLVNTGNKKEEHKFDKTELCIKRTVERHGDPIIIGLDKTDPSNVYRLWVDGDATDQVFFGTGDTLWFNPVIEPGYYRVYCNDRPLGYQGLLILFDATGAIKTAY